MIKNIKSMHCNQCVGASNIIRMKMKIMLINDHESQWKKLLEERITRKFTADAAAAFKLEHSVHQII